MKELVRERVCPTLTGTDRMEGSSVSVVQMSLGNAWSSVELSSVHGIQGQAFQTEQFSEKPREASLNQLAWRRL